MGGSVTGYCQQNWDQAFSQVLHSCLDRVLHSSPFGRCIVAHWELLKYNRRRRCRLHWLLGPICARPDLVQNPPTLWALKCCLQCRVDWKPETTGGLLCRDKLCGIRKKFGRCELLPESWLAQQWKWLGGEFLPLDMDLVSMSGDTWKPIAPKDSKQCIVVCCMIFCANNIALDIFSCLSTMSSLRLTPALSGKVESLLLRPGMNSCFRFDLLTLELGVMGDNCVHDRWRHTLSRYYHSEQLKILLKFKLECFIGTGNVKCTKIVHGFCKASSSNIHRFKYWIAEFYPISRLTVMGGKEPSGSMCGDRSGEVGDCMYACGGGGTRSAHI